MRNLPYSTPLIKKQAAKAVLKSQKKTSSFAQILLFFIALPAGLYLLSQHNLMKTLHDTIEPHLYRMNLAFFDFIDKHEQKIDSVRNQNVVRTLPAATLSTERTSHKTTLLPLDYYNPAFTKEDFLSDRYNRVPEIFKVSGAMKSRVGFWLDIYTRYSSHYHVIHHVDYPWLIFKVVDTTPVYLGKGHRWTKYHRARAIVRKSVHDIQKNLNKLARMKSYKRLSPELQKYYDLLSQVPGRRQRVFRHAATHIRSQLGQKDFFKSGLITGSKYLPQMEEIFAQYDLPVELTRLPLVESSFNEDAVSKVGASGIWQFMPHVGKNYLHINDTIDERNSPYKATEAAAKLLLSNFRMLKNWSFAVTAYNHGPGGIRKASKLLKTQDLAVIIKKYDSDRFGFASSNFYASFLAALHADRYQEEVFGQIPKYPPHHSDALLLTRKYRAGELIDIMGITMEELKLFNKDLKTRAVNRRTVLPRGYKIFLPLGRKARLELHQFKTDS